jgi:hypothetical protein
MVLRRLHDALVSLSHVERRLEPFFRAPADALLRAPQAALIQALINLGRPRETLGLAEERPIPDEAAHIQAILDTMRRHMESKYRPGDYQRAGNTKTHGIVRGEVTIRDDLPAHLRHGVFAEPKTYPAWVRYSGPGPDSPPDIDDVGFVSMTIKMMGVPGPKLLDDEKFTQDLLGICTPTFVTPDARANAKLQVWSLERTPLWYFFDPRDSHILDFWMQSLWNKTQSNPLGEAYYSCVPYLLGEGQAMQYSFQPLTRVPRHIPGLPFGKPPQNYLRDNMIATLKQSDVEFDITVQVQTDPWRMPIENAAVLWPESLSPRAPVARLRIPKQTFDSRAQFEFAKVLSYNPWHCLPEHRPLGNQSRTRLPLYSELSRFRQAENGVTHIEPTGDEVFG